jgi:hypothetical protein
MIAIKVKDLNKELSLYLVKIITGLRPHKKNWNQKENWKFIPSETTLTLFHFKS